VDVRPDDRALHERLAAAFERIGQTERACAHRVTIAELASSDAGALAAAVRCEDATGHAAGAARIVARIGDAALRDRVRTEAARSATTARAGGEVTVDATWSGDEDL